MKADARKRQLTLQHTATRCNTPQHAATRCNTSCRQEKRFSWKVDYFKSQLTPQFARSIANCNTLQHVAAHCNMLQHTKSSHLADKKDASSWQYMCSLQHTATHRNSLQHTAPHLADKEEISSWKMDVLAATHCNTLQHTATHCNTLQHTAPHGNTLQHTATHCHTSCRHEGSLFLEDRCSHE